MNPGYQVRIELTLKAHKESSDRKLVYTTYLDFVPREGLVLKFFNDDNDEIDFTFQSIYYDMRNKRFVEQQEDDELLQELREPGNPCCTVSRERMEQYIAEYHSFGFEPVPPSIFGPTP